MTDYTPGEHQTPDDSDAQHDQLLAECQHLRQVVADQQDLIEKQHRTLTDQVGRINDLEDRVQALEAGAEKSRDIARSAIAKTEQLAADTDDETDRLPDGIDPATSPLDFFANCRASKCKAMFVEQSNRVNTYRAIAVAKRWPEFARSRNDGDAVFFTRETFETALTAHLGRAPHRQTISRVWDALCELGGDDLVEKRHRVSASQQPKTLLVMDTETAEGLLDQRYLGLDLLTSTDAKARMGGVTPVVTGATG